MYKDLYRCYICVAQKRAIDVLEKIYVALKRAVVLESRLNSVSPVNSWWRLCQSKLDWWRSWRSVTCRRSWRREEVFWRTRFLSDCPLIWLWEILNSSGNSGWWPRLSSLLQRGESGRQTLESR